MQSLLFGLTLIGILIVIWWYIKNDKAGDTGRTTGILAMDYTVSGEATEPKHSARRGRSRDKASGETP